MCNLGPCPISLSEIKQYLRIDFSEDDPLLTGLLLAACDWVQEQTGQQVMPATIVYAMDRFPNGPELRLPRPPLRSFTLLRYFDPNGSNVLLPCNEFIVDTFARPARIVLKPGRSWPQTDGRANGVLIEFDAGPSPDTQTTSVHRDPVRPLSPQLRQAIKFIVGHWYEHREAASDRRIDEVPIALQAILSMNTFREAQ